MTHRIARIRSVILQSLISLLTLLSSGVESAQAQTDADDPVVTEFDVVPSWPKRPEHVSGKGWVSGLAVDAEDRVWFFRKGPDPVQVYTADGDFVRTWGRGMFESPHQVLMRFATSGRVLQTWTLPLGDIGENKDMPDTSKLKPGETIGRLLLRGIGVARPNLPDRVSRIDRRAELISTLR